MDMNGGENMSFDELTKKVNEFQPSDDPKADASQLAEYLEETLKLIGKLNDASAKRKKQEINAQLSGRIGK